MGFQSYLQQQETIVQQALFMQEYDPTTHEPSEEEGTPEDESRQEQAMGGSGSDSLGTKHYQEKYKHLLGGLECAKESAVKMEPNKKFGYGELEIDESAWDCC